MEEIVDQQQLRDDLDHFDIDDYLHQKKEMLDKRIQEYHIKIQALKLSREQHNGRRI